MNKLKSLFTDREDNLDLSAILGALAFLAFLILTFHAYFFGSQPFDPLGFGTGAGGLAAGHGAGKLMSNKGDYGQ